MLYIIGIGLCDEKDITVKGLEAVKKCDPVYLENYTSKLQCSVKDLEKLYSKKILLADRNLVEDGKEIIERAKKSNVALLVVGDALSATTHTAIILEAKRRKIEIKIIHNASIMTAIAATGLQLYKFGKTTSIPYPEKSFSPESAYDTVKTNLKNNLHTLLLLDIKPDKMMSCDEAKKILLGIEKKRKEKVVSEKTLCVCCSALGSDKQEIKLSSLGKQCKLKNFPQCMIMPAELHFSEEEFLNEF